MDYLASVSAHILLYFIFIAGLGKYILGKSSVWSIGHIAFWGLGGLVVGSLTVDFGVNAWIALLASVLFGIIISFLIGLASLRLDGDYFVILSVSLSELIRVIAIEYRGPGGFNGIIRPTFFGVSLENDWLFIVLALCPFVIATIIITLRLEQLHLNRIFLLVKENEILAKSFRYNPVYYKILIFCIGSFFATLSGGLYSLFIRGTDPSTTTLYQGVLLFAISLLSGINTLKGVLLGALLFVAAPRMLEYIITAPGSATYSYNIIQLVYGILLLIVVLLTSRVPVYQK